VFGRPTSSSAICLALAAVLVLISTRGSNPWLLLIGAALAAGPLLSQVLRPDLGSVSICFRGAERVGLGETTEQLFHVHNRGRRTTPVLRLTHEVDGFTPLALAVPALAPGERADLTVHRTPVARAVADEHRLALRTTAPFGLAVHRRTLLVVSRTVVHPRRVPVARLFGAVHGERPSGRPARVGSEPHALAEWRRGEGLRQVHWRASARHDRLMVVVPEATVQSRLALVVGGIPHDSRWEELLATAAWTAVEAASEGPVRLLAAGVPDYEGDDAGAVLDWFAGLRFVPSPPRSLLAEAERWTGPDGAVVLASTRAPEEMGLAGASRMVVIGAPA
jgi:uncharacterized protein (DUF58 family)